MRTTHLTQLAYSPAELAAAVGLSESLIRECIHGTNPHFGHLKAKRIRKAGSKRSQIKIPLQDAMDWIERWDDL